VLSFVGAVWQGLGAIGAAFTLLGLIQLLRASTSYGFGAASSGTLLMVAIYSGAQILAPILLLAGGVQLLRHHASGRRLITVGCLLVLVLRAFEGLAFYGVFQWMTGLFGSDAVTSDVYGEFAKAGLIVVALPALLAVVTMLFTASPATRNWCQSTHPAPHAGHIAY
jgi:hypothetical protein